MNNTTPSKYEVFQLGMDNRCILNTDTIATQRNNNILVMGGTGTGKTSCITNNMILGLENSNAVIVCTKQGNMDTFSRILGLKGYNVLKIDFTAPGKGNYGYDPLKCCTCPEDIAHLAYSIIRSDPSGRVGHDPYWENSAANLLEFLLKYVRSGKYSKSNSAKPASTSAGGGCLMNPKGNWSVHRFVNPLAEGTQEKLKPGSMKAMLTLMNDFHWLYHGDENIPSEKNTPEYAEYLDELKKNHPLHWELENTNKLTAKDAAVWKNFVQLPNTTGSCVTSSLTAPFNKVFSSTIPQLIWKDNQFSFQKLLKPKTVLFIKTSPVNDVLNSFITIFYSQLFKNLFELAEKQPDHVLPYPVHVICDDFATGCQVQDFDKQISVFREKGISATLLVQSQSQLASLYGQAAAKTIINNCDTLIYLGGSDLDTCSEISRRLNRPLHEVLNMPIGKEIFFQRGQKPVITRRRSFRETPEYLKYAQKSTTKTA